MVAAVQEEGGLPWLASPLLPAGGGEQAPGQHQGLTGETGHHAVLLDGSFFLHSFAILVVYLCSLLNFSVTNFAYFINQISLLLNCLQNVHCILLKVLHSAGEAVQGPGGQRQGGARGQAAVGPLRPSGCS